MRESRSAWASSPGGQVEPGVFTEHGRQVGRHEGRPARFAVVLHPRGHDRRRGGLSGGVGPAAQPPRAQRRVAGQVGAVQGIQEGGGLGHRHRLLQRQPQLQSAPARYRNGRRRQLQLGLQGGPQRPQGRPVGRAGQLDPEAAHLSRVRTEAALGQVKQALKLGAESCHGGPDYRPARWRRTRAAALHPAHPPPASRGRCRRPTR